MTEPTSRATTKAGAGAIERMRPLGAIDLPALAELHARCFPSEPWSCEALGVLLAQPGVVGFLAERKDRLIAFVLLRRVADEAEVLSLGVEEGQRRQGIARRLLALGLEQLGPDIQRIFLEVAVQNRAAIALYRGLCFRVVGQRENYYRSGSDALVLRCDLADISWRNSDKVQ